MAKNQAPQADEVDQLLALNKTAGTSSGGGRSGSAVEAFVREVRPIAEAASRELGVDPSYLIGQWGLETGWGKSVIPGTNNYGNIKDFRGGGKSAKDNMTGSVDKYRAYGSPEDFAKDYAQLLRGQRYSSAMGSKDAQSFFSALKAGGYAEDPNYVRSGVRAAEMARNAMGGSSSGASLYPSRGEYIGGTEQVMRDTERQAVSDESPISTSLERGLEGLKHNAGLFMDNLADDSEGAAERIKAKREWDAANPAPSSSTKFLKHWQDLAEDDYMGMLGSVLSNPGGMVNQLVEQTPNSLPGLALQVPVALATTGLIASGWGAPIAVGLQGLASFVGNVLPEGGSVIEERLAKAGVDPNNTQAVARWISENRGANLEAGVKKAGVISAVDGATGYLVGKLIAGPSARFAKAEAKVFADAGVDVSNKAARDAARATPAYKAAMAEPAKELLAATTTAQKVARHAGGFAAETVGEGVGEYGGSYAANGEASVKDAVLESLMGAGTSAAMTGAGSVMSAMKAPEMARADLEALAATPVQPTIEANSPLSNMASIGQAEAANAAQAAGAPQVDATVQAGESGASSDPIATRLAAMQSFVEDKAFIQALRGTQGYGPESVTEMLSAFAKARNPNIDPMVRERALSDLEGFIQGFNNRPNFVFGENTQERTQPPGQQVVPVSQNGRAVSRPIRRDDGRTLDGEIITRPDTMASANPNQLSAPPVLGLPTEEALAAKRQADADYDQAFQDLVKAEQLGATESELAEYQRTLMEAERLRNELAAQLSDTDARVSDAQRREAEARRREILARVIEEGISGVNPVADVSNRFAAELRRQGYQNADPTEAESQSILRAVDVANAREDGPLPSLPNEADFYEPPKPPRATAPKAEIKPKQQPARKLTPLEIRKYISAGAVLNGDTLTLPDGTAIKLKGPQVAAAREAIRKAGQPQVESAPVEDNESESRDGLIAQLRQSEPFSDEESDLSDRLVEMTRREVQAKLDRGEMPVFDTKRDTFATISPSAQAPGKIQVTRYNKDGVWGDTQYGSVDDAIRDNRFDRYSILSEIDASKRFAESLEAEAQYELARRDPTPEIRNAIDAAAHEAATSPLNDTPQPTDAQKEAGNYKVGRVRIQGMDISIENPRGSVRSGTSPDGTAWSNTLHSHYGYLVGTKAADGDNLDVYLTDGAEDAPMVWVIDQKNTDGSFDEHKALIGPLTEAEARDAYLANYTPGWDGIGAISSMPVDAFKAWAYDGKKKRKPLVYVEPEAKPAAPQLPSKPVALVNRVHLHYDDLLAMSADAGWAERGGALLRDTQGNAVGRTKWIPRSEWFVAGMEPDPEVIRTAIERIADGNFVIAKSRRTVEGMLDWLESKKDSTAAEEDRSAYDHDPDGYLEVGTPAADFYDSFDDLLAGSPLTGDEAMRALGFTEEEINEAANAGRTVASRQGEARQAQSNSAETGNQADRPGDDTQGPALESYTEQDLAERAEAQRLAEEVRAKADREADNKARADAERDTFTLTGSDRPADVMATMGQGGLFDAPASGDNQNPIKSEAPASTGESAESAAQDQEPIKNQSSDLEAIFTGLASRGLAKTRAKQAAASHPQAEQIAYVQENFHDILIQLMDAGKLEVNGSKTVTEDNKTCL